MTDREKLAKLLYATGYFINPFVAGYVAEKLLAKGVTVQKWIPVEDRLPEKWRYVLALDKYDEESWEHCIAYIDDKGWVAAGIVGCKITHWMPLPEPPKEGNHETD